LTLHVISTPLSGKPLTRAALSGTTPPEWYVPRPHGAEAWRARAESMTSALQSRDWLTPLSQAFDATGVAADRLSAAAQGGFVVTVGQQPGLFGGPLYTWWKALSARAFADALQEATGVPVAPVFWAATDDSDFTEASWTVVATPDGAQKIQLDRVDDSGLPMALVPLGDVAAQLKALSSAAGSASYPAILDAVVSAYGPGRSVGDAYVALLRDVLAPLGVSVLDASHPAVRQQGAPLLRRALERAHEVEAALLARDAELKAAGFSPQVQTVRGRSLVFSAADGRRARLSSRHPGELSGGSNAIDLSPNVLLRPVLERTILPTVAYMGGPAEIAYFAQVSAVAAALESEPPLILPRWSGMVIEQRVQKIVDRYSLTPADFADPHAVETRLAKESLPADLRSRLDDMRREIDEQISLLSASEGSRLVSDTVAAGLKRNMLHLIDRLERRYTAAIKREGNEALRDAAVARAALYPLGFPQERALNGIPLIARHGEELFDSVMSEAAKHAASLL
jgi:uncharacterized protein YllA (UPF0747 family)